MSDPTMERRQTPVSHTRLIGRMWSELAGPTLLVVGSLHGNEPAGVLAARRVFERLAAAGYRIERDPADTTPDYSGPPPLDPPPPLRGEFVAFTGNLRALAQGRRFNHRDLNRQWSPSRIAQIEAHGPQADEDHEVIELKRELDAVLARARGTVYFVDLHTTSADGVPFSMVLRDPRVQAFALNFHLPIMLGLLETVEGDLTEYLHNRRCLSLGVEGGQNDRAVSVDNLDAVLCVALVAAGVLPPKALPALDDSRNRLEKSRGGLPRMIEIYDRHPITAEDQFKMMPGYRNIQRIKRGELLAHDRRGEIRAQGDGILLMPLYQAQGEDGFFLGRELLA